MKIKYVSVVVIYSLMMCSCASNNRYAEQYYRKCTPIRLYEQDQVNFRRSVWRDHVYSLGVSFFYPRGDAFSEFENKFPLLVKLNPDAREGCGLAGLVCPEIKLRQAPEQLRFWVRIVRVDKPEVFFDGEMHAKFINNGSAGVIDMPFYKPEIPKGVYDRFIMEKGVYDITVENLNSSANFIDERTCINFFEETHK